MTMAWLTVPTRREHAVTEKGDRESCGMHEEDGWNLNRTCNAVFPAANVTTT